MGLASAGLYISDGVIGMHLPSDLGKVFMTNEFIIGVGLYFILMMVIGYLASRRVKTLANYLTANRSLPFFLALPTIVATWFGAGSCMGVSGTVYKEGFYGVLADPFGCSLALIIAGLFFAARFHRLKLYTISDLLGRSFGPRFERISTLVTIPFYIGTLASQMVAMGYIFHIISGQDPQMGMVIGSLIVLIYTASGGMWAVTLTDFVQLVMLSIGLALIVPICLDQVPDQAATFHTFLSEFSTLVPAQKSDIFSFVGRILMTGLGAIMGQDLIQRLLAGSSEEIARSSAIAAGGLYFLLGLIPLFIGIAGKSIFPDLDQPEQLIPLLAKQFLSPFAFAIFACGLLSAIMSTADSYLLAGASLITQNLLLKSYPDQTEKTKLRWMRTVNVSLVVSALGLAFTGQSIFNMMVHSGATLFVGILVPTSAALFLKKTNQTAAWSALICGIASWSLLVIYRLEDLSEDALFSAATFGGLVSLISYVGVSLISWMRGRREIVLE